MFANIFGDKSWYDSLTAWGVLVYGALEAGEQAGLIPAGLGATLTQFGQSVGGLLIVLGLRRAAN